MLKEATDLLDVLRSVERAASSIERDASRDLAMLGRSIMRQHTRYGRWHDVCITTYDHEAYALVLEAEALRREALDIWTQAEAVLTRH
jgi:hypothetical protein